MSQSTSVTSSLENANASCRPSPPPPPYNSNKNIWITDLAQTVNLISIANKALSPRVAFLLCCIQCKLAQTIVFFHYCIEFDVTEMWCLNRA